MEGGADPGASQATVLGRHMPHEQVFEFDWSLHAEVSDLAWAAEKLVIGSELRSIANQGRVDGQRFGIGLIIPVAPAVKPLVILGSNPLRVLGTGPHLMDGAVEEPLELGWEQVDELLGKREHLPRAHAEELIAAPVSRSTKRSAVGPSGIGLLPYGLDR
jgi:hypothetical protein